MRPKAATAVFLASLMVWYPVLSVTAGSVPLGKVVPRGPADLNGARLELETTVYSGDTVATVEDGLALVLLPQGDQVHVGPASTVQVVDAQGVVFASLERGAVLVRNGSGQAIAVQARGLVIRPQGAARYEVHLAEKGVDVLAEQGTVTVQAANGSHTVPAGKALRFEVAPATGPQAAAGASGGSGVIGLFSLITLIISIATIPVSYVVANKLADDARKEGCIAGIQAVSPTAPTTKCK